MVEFQHLNYVDAQPLPPMFVMTFLYNFYEAVPRNNAVESSLCFVLWTPASIFILGNLACRSCFLGVFSQSAKSRDLYQNKPQDYVQQECRSVKNRLVDGFGCFEATYICYDVMKTSHAWVLG